MSFSPNPVRGALGPTAAQGGFPYPGRTCAEWRSDERHHELTERERGQDAARGSAALREAILRCSHYYPQRPAFVHSWAQPSRAADTAR